MECQHGHSMTGSSPRTTPSGDSTFKVYCENCGVGYEVSFRVTGRGVQSKATIFPATGSETISRDVTRRLLALWESANEEYERKGYEVSRETPTFLGIPVGNGLRQAIPIPPQPKPILPMNRLAERARVLGFLSLLASPFAIAALICGYLALGQIRDRGEDGRSEALTGITLGWIIVGFNFLLLILIANSQT